MSVALVQYTLGALLTNYYCQLHQSNKRAQMTLSWLTILCVEMLNRLTELRELP